jgi:uncharacterized BrkB/YihY/UPF0761 family membrane protein
VTQDRSDPVEHGVHLVALCRDVRTVQALSAFGGVLAGMLWMNVVSQALFFGAELCKVVATQGEQRGRDTPPPPTGS